MHPLAPMQATLNEAAGIEPAAPEIAMGVDAQAKPVATPTAFARCVLKDLASDLQNLCHELSIPLACE